MLAVVRKDQALAQSFGIEVKADSIGPKIGSRLSGGLRAAPAGMSFVDVTGVTDADTDGIVFEGKPGLERPIIPRFMVPKDLARKLSGIVEGDAEAIEKQRRAGNTSVQFDEGKLRNIIASVGGDASLLQAVTNDRGVPATTTSGRERVSAAVRNVTGNVASRRMDIASRRMRSGQRTDLGDATPLSAGELNKLSEQEIVDRLIEDRYAGLNLDEAAKKYGLKGGRVEARRLEAREMSRRAGGMRSRMNTSGAPKEYADALESSSHYFGYIKENPYKGFPNHPAEPSIYWNDEDKGWELSFGYDPSVDLLITSDDPQAAARTIEGILDEANGRFDSEAYAGSEYDSDYQDISDFGTSSYVDDFNSESDDVKITLLNDSGMRSRSGYVSGVSSIVDDYLDHPQSDDDFAEWQKDNPGKTEKDFINDVEDIVEEMFAEQYNPDSPIYIEDVMDRVEARRLENRRDGGMRSRSGGMRSSNYTTMDDIGTTDPYSRKFREKINSRLDREPVLNGRILRINELVSYQPGKQGHEAMSNEIANHIAKTRDAIYDAVLSGDIDTEEADNFIYQMFQTLDSPLQEVFGVENRGGVWNIMTTPAQEKFENDFTSDAEERFKKAAVIAESMGALKDRGAAGEGELFEPIGDFDPRQGKDLIDEADKYLDYELESLHDWSKENPLANSDEVYAHWSEKIKEQTKLLEDDDLNDHVDSFLRDSEVEFSNLAFENERDHLAGRADAVMRGAGMRSRSGMRSSTETERRPHLNVRVTGSSALRQASFNEEKDELVVTYANGKTYTYENLSYDDLDEILSGPDRILSGSAVNEIKKKYDFREGGTHTFDPQYQDVQGPGGEFSVEKLSRLGRGEKTQIPVTGSSAIEALTWDDDKKDLIVTYAGGRTYTYKDVDSYWIEDLERETGTGRIINNIKKEGYRVVDGGEHGDMPSEGLTAERANFGMRSRMAPSSGRIRAAEMEISARPQGMASRRSEGLRDPRFAVPGRDRVDPSDGQLWGRLSDEEKATVAGRAVNREKMLLNEFKQRFPRWWDRASKEADKKGWDKDLMKGGNAGWLDELHRFVTKLADDPNYPEKSRADAEKQFNDLQALYNMRANRGSHDLLEHLNPTSRRYLFDDARRDDSKKTSISASGKEMKTPSTAPRPFGDPIDVGTPIREQVGQNQKKPLKERLDSYYKRMSDKILYTDPARQARREMRKARRQGINAGGFTESEANPVDDAKRKIRRRKRIKQMRKNRTRDISTLSDSSTNNRIDGRLAHTDSQGSLVFGDKLTSTLSTMMTNYRTEAKLKKTKGGVNKNRALAVLWDGAGYNGTPSIITPDEFKTLHAAGWVPVVRGHGQGSNGVRYANDWIDDPVRFITGQGGEAQGEGEYWARATQGGGGWFGYMDGSLPAGTVGLLPPSTRRVTKGELRKIQSDHAPLAKAIKSFDVGLPTGEREKMDAEEYVSQLRDHLRTSLGSAYESTMSTKIGQMTSKILDSLSGSSDSKKQELLDSLEFLELISKKRTSNSYAPLLGYDTITADSGVELIHNRTAIAIVGDTFKRDDAVNLAKSKAQVKGIMETGTNERMFMQQHSHLSELMDYPPFTTSIQKSQAFEDGLAAAYDVISKKLDKSGDDMGSARDEAFKDSHKSLVSKYIDDIEEAELYRVRYGQDIEAAQAAALEAEGKTIDDDGVPYL